MSPTRDARAPELGRLGVACYNEKIVFASFEVRDLDTQLLIAMLNSLKDPFLFVDTDHIVRFVNDAARRHYGDKTPAVGTSVLDCHNADSQRLMLEILNAMRDGEVERLITDDAQHRIYMRSVRDTNGDVLGYYERYEPPAQR